MSLLVMPEKFQRVIGQSMIRLTLHYTLTPNWFRYDLIYHNPIKNPTQVQGVITRPIHYKSTFCL